MSSSFASDALNGVGLWITRREPSRERDDTAVLSVLTALNMTQRYLAGPERGEEVDGSAEGELMELWASASVQIRRTDSDLAEKLLEEADWANPMHWSEKDVVDNGIQIDKMADEAVRLLGGE